ncbi:MAG: hypothetical protein AMXMBFR84_40970 [Candidatus Hydrogenedentota bacterium]
MKKLSIWALAAALAIGISACTPKTDTTTDSAAPADSTAPADTAAPADAAPADTAPAETPAPAAAATKATITAKVVTAGDGYALEVVDAKGEDGAAIADWAGVTLTFATPEDSKGIATTADLADKTISVVGTVDAAAKTIVVETYEVAATDAAGGAVQINADEFAGFDFSASGSASGKR